MNSEQKSLLSAEFSAFESASDHLSFDQRMLLLSLWYAAKHEGIPKSIERAISLAVNAGVDPKEAACLCTAEVMTALHQCLATPTAVGA